MTKVSVIVPNYNHQPFLKQRIDSILVQTYQDFELIILDDCSSDDSKSVIENYRKNPKTSHIVYNEKNSGSPFLQWEKGLTLASGNFIWIAESDDFAEPDFLKRTIAQIECTEHIGLVYTDSNIIRDGVKTDNFKNRNRTYLTETNWQEDYIITGIKELELHLAENCTIYNVSAVLFRKEAFYSAIKQIGGFKFAGDWVCYMLIALNYNICYIAETLSNYRSHNHNLTKKAGNNYLAMIERVKARHFLKTKLAVNQNHLVNKIVRLNMLELRALLSGCLRGKLSFLTLFKTLKYYI